MIPINKVSQKMVGLVASQTFSNASPGTHLTRTFSKEFADVLQKQASDLGPVDGDVLLIPVASNRAALLTPDKLEHRNINVEFNWFIMFFNSIQTRSPMVHHHLYEIERDITIVLTIIIMELLATRTQRFKEARTA